MFGTFRDYINYIDPDSGLLTEIKLYSDQFGYGDSQPLVNDTTVVQGSTNE